MKKIIVAFDGLRFSETTLQYAVYMGQQFNSHLVGVFLRESTRLAYAVYESIVNQAFPTPELAEEIGQSDLALINQGIARFSAACQEAKLEYTIHRENHNAAEDLVHETIFADLLIIDSGETFSYIDGSMPGLFLRNVLHHAQCPVVVVPKKFQPLQKIIFLYDGTPTSVFAIKMFNYILGSLKTVPAELLCAKAEGANLHLPDNKLLKEWMKRHYPQVNYHVLKGNGRELANHIANEPPGALVVAGAFHRSNLSMWLRQSMGALLMREAKVPVFIAHT